MAARVLRVDPSSPDASLIRVAAKTIVDGGLVAFPTETVYGLGADALNVEAVRAIYDAKGRPVDNPVIVHVADAGALPALVTGVPTRAKALIDTYWPGPLTLVLRAAASVPPITRGGLDTVAVRMPAHPVALALIHAAGRPVAAPSANRSGRPSPTTASHVLDDLGDRIDVVVDGGPTLVGVESTVLDLTTDPPTLLRPGGATLESLKATLGEVAVAAGSPQVAARSPGTRYRHYAPRTRLMLVEARSGDAAAVASVVRRCWERGLRVGAMVTVETAASVPSGAVVRIMGRRDHPVEIAAGLFAHLRELDDAGLDVIVVEGISEAGVGRAVMDRLRRAAGEGG
jgi:L-threonylcarbamoyladenylate synthase